MTDDEIAIEQLQRAVRWLAGLAGAEPCEACKGEGRGWHRGVYDGWWDRCYSCDGIGFKKPKP